MKALVVMREVMPVDHLGLAATARAVKSGGVTA